MQQPRGKAPTARRRIVRTSPQRRVTREISDPTEKFLRKYSKDYEAFERHTYAFSGRARSKSGPETVDGFRADTSSDEAFNPLNRLRRR